MKRFYLTGRWTCSKECRHDLVNVPERITGWVNIYRQRDGTIFTGRTIFSSEQAAKDMPSTYPKISTAHIDTYANH